MILDQITYNFCIGSATVLLAGTMALAQQPMNPGPQPVPGRQPDQPINSAPGIASTGQDFGDKAFVSKAMEGDNTEVQLGQLAQQKSQSADVKQLAQKLASEHSQMNEKWFKPVAQELGVSEPKGPSKKDKKTMEKLQNLSGSEFDTQYLTMMLKDHQQDLKQYKDEAKLAQDPNVKHVAEQGANVIAQHLQAIEQVARNHNIETPQSSKPSM